MSKKRVDVICILEDTLKSVLAKKGNYFYLEEGKNSASTPKKSAKNDTLQKIIINMGINYAEGNYLAFSPDELIITSSREVFVTPIWKIKDQDIEEKHGISMSYNRACDCVVIIENEERYDIVYIEMKSTRYQLKSCSEQFESTRCLIEYIRHVVKYVFKKEFEIRREYFLLLCVDNASARKLTQSERREQGKSSEIPNIQQVKNLEKFVLPKIK